MRTLVFRENQTNCENDKSIETLLTASHVDGGHADVRCSYISSAKSHPQREDGLQLQRQHVGVVD